MVKCSEIVEKNGEIYFEDSKGSLIYIGEEIPIMYIWEQLETEEVQATFNFEFKGKGKNITLNRSDYMSANGLTELLAKGAPINTKFKNIYPLYFANLEEDAQMMFRHRNIGFDHVNGELVFKAFKCIGKKSEYNGDLEIKPKGAFSKWKKVVEEEVLGNEYLELAVAIGLSSALVGLLGEKLGLDSLIVHISGNSTTGKSTAAKLAISVWGYTDTKKEGLMTTYNSTKNAMLAKLNYNYGLAICFDELSMSNAKSYTDFIYNLANGRDKARLNQDSTLKEAGNWFTTILSTGELSILEKCAQNIGLKVRVIEIRDKMLTRDAENSDNIKKVIAENYGLAGIKFASYLLKIGEEEIVSIYNRLINRISKIMKKRGLNDQYIDRRVLKIALFLLSAELAEPALGLKFDIKQMTKTLVKLEKEAMNERQLDENAHNYLINQIISNRQRFNERNDKSGTSSNAKLNPIWGTIVKLKSGKREVEIPKERFDDLMKQGGYESPKTIISEWKKKGLLNYEKDRTTRKRRIGYDELTNVYVIKFREEGEDTVI